MKHMQKESIPPQENKPVQYNRYFQNIRKYLRELSVVVAGIAITFLSVGGSLGFGRKRC